MPRDPEKAKAWKRRYLQKQKIEKYGVEAADKDMRGRHGHHAKGERNGRWNSSGRLLTSHGYVAVRVDPEHPRAWGPSHGSQRYAYEHDLVAEEMIGRHLQPNEIVHHRNGDKTNNRPENLAVETRSDHAREHTAVPGARDELGRFAPVNPRVRKMSP
ncbi:MAG TPA: HNH endonuclease signature motif containing protein [Thauera aminoaromatica]|nr:HNH endonuclease signature motif containing protein [Thauera aminoaromatica]